MTTDPLFNFPRELIEGVEIPVSGAPESSVLRLVRIFSKGSATSGTSEEVKTFEGGNLDDENIAELIPPDESEGKKLLNMLFSIVDIMNVPCCGDVLGDGDEYESRGLSVKAVEVEDEPSEEDSEGEGEEQKSVEEGDESEV